MHVRTEFAGSGENSSDVFVSANLVLTFPQKCEGVLALTSVELRDEVSASDTTEPETTTEVDYYAEYVEPESINLHPMSDSFAAALKENDLRFVSWASTLHGTK